jgi:acyl dehydratase
MQEECGTTRRQSLNTKREEQFILEASNDPDKRSPRYLDDLYVGQRFMSGTRQIDAAQIQAFAREFDPQPFHLDPQAAKGTIFQGLVASGWHTASITMRLLVESGLSIAGGLVGAGAEISWPKPTRPDSILHVETEIVDLKSSRSRPDRGIATIRCETRNQLGEIVQVLTAKLMIPRNPASDVNH